jgi:DNA-binding FadR family transcriptional regulator
VLRPREQVEDQLKEAIFSGQFVHGQKLPSEADLSEQFSVSRATVREALRSLASLGLITKIPGAAGGSFVRSVNHEALSDTLRESMDNILRLGTLELHEATAVRRLLEVPSAELAARNRTEAELATLKEIAEAHRTAEWNDPAIARYDIAFHRAIAQAGKNRLLSAFVTALHLASQPVFFLDLTPALSKKVVRQHAAIAKAIAEQDEAAAGKAMEEHLLFLEKTSRVAIRDNNLNRPVG